MGLDGTNIGIATAGLPELSPIRRVSAGISAVTRLRVGYHRTTVF